MITFGRLDVTHRVMVEGTVQMDLLKIIHDLRQERNKLEAIILSLEQLQGDSPTKATVSFSRRGRRSMDADGRLEVSRRMKKYWEARRKQDSFVKSAAEGSPADRSMTA